MDVLSDGSILAAIANILQVVGGAVPGPSQIWVLAVGAAIGAIAATLKGRK